jgi:hypothetical protein
MIMKITMNYELAMAAAKDEANRRMRKQGRKHWNRQDYNAAVKEFNRLWPIEAEMAAQQRAA